MAADGVCREELVREIKLNFPTIRFEAQLYAVQPLVVPAKKDPHIATIFDELMTIEDFRDAVEEVSQG